MSIVSKDIDVLDKFFKEQQEIGAKKERKALIPLMAIMCSGSLLLGTQLVASPLKQPSFPLQQEEVSLPAAYDFTEPMPELVNPLEIPPTIADWITTE